MTFGAKFNRKGNAVLDGITIIVVVIVMAIALVFGNMVLDELNTDIQNSDDVGSDAKTVTGDLNSKYVSLFDNLFLFAFILFVVFVLVSVFLIDTHPVFFVVSVILLIFVFVIAGLLANTYNDIATDSAVSTYANNFTYISWVMSHLLEVIIGIGFLVSVVLFAKYKS